MTAISRAIEQASLIHQPEIPSDLNEALLSIIIQSENAPILFDLSDFSPIARLSDRSWFKRLWIAQEYFCANGVVFCCGRKFVAAENLWVSPSIPSVGQYQRHSKRKTNLAFIPDFEC
jgi:hypothetical protein